MEQNQQVQQMTPQMTQQVPVDLPHKYNNKIIIALSIFILTVLLVAGVYLVNNLSSIQQDVYISEVPSTSSPVVSENIVAPTDSEIATNMNWKIELESYSFKASELSAEKESEENDPNTMPQTGGPNGVSGNLFGPLNEGELICSAINYNVSHFLEKKQENSWQRLCDQTIDTDIEAQSSGDRIYCENYTPTKGKWVFGISNLTHDCDTLENRIEAGIYRMHAIIYTACETDGSYNATPGSCKNKVDVYSPEFTVTDE